MRFLIVISFLSSLCSFAAYADIVPFGKLDSEAKERPSRDGQDVESFMEELVKSAQGDLDAAFEGIEGVDGDTVIITAKERAEAENDSDDGAEVAKDLESEADTDDGAEANDALSPETEIEDAVEAKGTEKEKTEEGLFGSNSVGGQDLIFVLLPLVLLGVVAFIRRRELFGK